MTIDRRFLAMVMATIACGEEEGGEMTAEFFSAENRMRCGQCGGKVTDPGQGYRVLCENCIREAEARGVRLEADAWREIARTTMLDGASAKVLCEALGQEKARRVAEAMSRLCLPDDWMVIAAHTIAEKARKAKR